ncbi:Proton-dependent oligopeptide transporter family [Heracleum sosnowskyi]|uniref:Proton-dependent oligopeptide transporter family n=1 Tax=Heracleum sosnowskyi TaxID=360622 RepID=A0AAD8IEK3_9APIA|nr:Proton-dependent oligopeptide transporter family [Heracleum sosnowskyi]
MVKRGLTKPCILLIVIAGLERFAFKGVASNLVTYLTDVMKMSNSSAARTVNSWCGFTSMLPLLVAPFVDSYWDRYCTILASSSIYALGLLALTSTALDWPWSHSNGNSSSLSLYWSLYMISLGQGGYNPSLQAFGADQLNIEDELPSTKADEDENSETKSLFFQWWYFGICIGSLMGISLMAYIQDTLGWGLGFAIPTIAMVTSILLFSCGTKFYAYKQTKTVDMKFISKVFQNVKATALRMIRMRKSGIILSNSNSDVIELELQEKPLCQEDQDKTEGLEEAPKNGYYLLEIAKVILRLLPIWTMLLMFAVIFQQPPTFFTKQGMTMKRNIGSHFKIPPATLQSAITLSIIILMPFYDAFFIPLARFITRNEKGISVMQRMGIGMFLSVIAMILAALVETKRLELSKNLTVLDPKSETVALSIFWLLPQYIILGISDIFTVVGMQEFFYSEVPVSMRTMGIALYTSVFGVGSFLSALLISLVEHFTSSNGGKQGWFSDDMGEARLDKYYWLLAFSSAVSLIMYIVLCKFFKSRT